MTNVHIPNTDPEELVGQWVNLSHTLDVDEERAVLAQVDVQPTPDALPDDCEEYTVTFDAGTDAPYDLLRTGQGSYILTTRDNWRERVPFPPTD